MQEKYLPNGMEIRIRLNRASPNFCLMGTAAGKVPFTQAGFNVRTVDLLPIVATQLNQQIAQHNMKIPIKRAEVKTFTIPGDCRLLAGSSADGLSSPEVTVQKGDFRFTQGPDEDVMYIFAALRVDKGDRRYFCMTDPTQISPGYTRLVFNTDWLKKRPSKNHREQNEELMIKKPYLDFLDPCTSMYVNRNKLLKILCNIFQGEFHSPEMEKRFISYDVDDILQVPEKSYSHHGPAITVDRTALN
ncbi:hypothetical protein ACF0H5_012239 [Mactra antiquata]